MMHWLWQTGFNYKRAVNDKLLVDLPGILSQLYLLI